MKIYVFLMLTFLKVLKDQALNKRYIAEKDDFDILRGPYVIFNDLQGHTLSYIICIIMLAFIEGFIKIGS